MTQTNNGRTIAFFDTTLRDGEQTPGVRLSRAHKVEIARQLQRAGIDVIEAGFPASSAGDMAAVKAIASEITDTTIAALSRTVKADIDAAREALRTAKKPRIHLFIATSDIHIEHKLAMTRQSVLERITECVGYAKSLCGDIEFSAEDASRTDPDYLIEALKRAALAGANVINVPDTVGYAMPDEFGALISRIRAELDALERENGLDHVILSVHCHNDLGCAVSCSLRAVECGAEQVECTVNGVGERAGNAAFEEIAMAIFTRRDLFNVDFNIDTTQLTRTSRLVASLFALPIPPNKAIVGSNAFSHEAGIHQHGMIADRRTYEIMTPETVGLSSSNLVLGKLSGRHAFSARLTELGYHLDGEGIDECFTRFKSCADKKSVCDEDIMAIVNEYLDSRQAIYSLDSFQIQSGNKMSSMAMITLGCRGAFVSEAAIGDGPIDAAFNAVNRLSGATDVTLEEYGIKAVTEGADALGEAMVRVRIDGASYSGRSVSTDIIEASVKAYVNAMNKWADRI